MTPTIVVRDGGVTRVAGPGVTISVAGGAVASVDGLVGVVSLPTDAAAGTGSKRTLGYGPTQAAKGSDLLTLAASVLTQSLANAEGDLLVANGADDFQIKPVGADGTVLTADAASPLGVKWGPGGIIPINLIATDYTAQAADIGGLVAQDMATPGTVRFPSGLLSPGEWVRVVRLGAGGLTVGPTELLFVNDPMTGTDGDELYGATPEHTAYEAWLKHPTASTAIPTILTNRAKGQGSGNPSRAIATSDAASADYAAIADFYKAGSTASEYASLWVRLNATTLTGYQIRWVSNAGVMTWRIYEYNSSGVATQLGSDWIDNPADTTIRRCQIKAIGNQITAEVRQTDDTVLHTFGPFTSSTVAAKGKLGLTFQGQAVRVDSVSGSNLVNIRSYGGYSLLAPNTVAEIVGLADDDLLLVGNLM